MKKIHKELVSLFSGLSLETLTRRMNALETVIFREQKYIMKNGKANDANPDSRWISYKLVAAQNLKTWDAMKAARDEKKARNFGAGAGR